MKVEIQIPSSLSEITLEQYQKFAKLNTDENQDSSFLMHKTVEIFCDLNLRDIAKIKYIYVQEILNDINKLFESKQDLIPTFRLKGVDYGFVPVLDDMTLGEYIDLDTFIGDWDNIEKAMNVLYRPITNKYKHKYSIEDYNVEPNINLLNMPMDAVTSSIFFFYHLGNDLSHYLMDSLTQDLAKDKELEIHLEKNGAGINQFTQSLEEISRGLKKLQSYRLPNA